MSNVDLARRAAKIRRYGGVSEMPKKSFEPPKREPKKLQIKLGKKVGRGQNVDVFLADRLESIYDRKKLCLKVFKNSNDQWGHDDIVGKSSILECTMIQNLLAMRGLAPRVYDLVIANGKTAQVTDYLEGHNKVVPFEDERFIFRKSEIMQDHQFISGKLVDFQGTVFRDFKKYKERVLKECVASQQPQSGGGKIYQSTNYIDGWRNTGERLKKFEGIDFKNKRVLDLGCNTGMLCRYAFDRGAVRVVGIDLPNVAEATKKLAVLDGYFNLDFYGANLRQTDWVKIVNLTKLRRFDIFLFLAVQNHIGKPDWLNKCDTLVYEGHGEVRPFSITRN